jgi:hypothetical protein
MMIGDDGVYGCQAKLCASWPVEEAVGAAHTAHAFLTMA